MCTCNDIRMCAVSKWLYIRPFIVSFIIQVSIDVTSHSRFINCDINVLVLYFFYYDII